ncbi:MAG: photosynthetic complex assembly protein PuhC [Hyphomicrobiaceae bacterium]|nr:photosynthetic complex assembly protein PuhC [Hyphomicrobiaceae bacterium]
MTVHAQSRRKPEPFPKSALYGAATLIAFTFILVIGARIAGYKMDWVPEAVAVADRQIAFTTTAEGNVEVRDFGTGKILGFYDRDENAFVRTVMLGLMHDRSLTRPDDKTTPFRITRWHDGRVSVSDPVSGRSIELAAFGRNQVETFEKLLQ